MKALGVIALLFVCGGIAAATPETSRLFERRVDSRSGVVSYLLKRDLTDFNQQSLYFTARSMTDDGRFLVFDASPDEFHTNSARKVKWLIDFDKDELIKLSGIGGQIPYVGVVNDRLVYMNKSGVWQRDFKDDPSKERLICRLPPELEATCGDVRYHTHLTLSADGRKAFCDALINHTNLQGVVNLETGTFEKWGDVDFCCNHGQFNPVNDRQALCAWEFAWEKYQWNRARTSLVHPPRPKDEVYPRLWIIGPDRDYQMIAPLEMRYATHENFDADGQGFYWCGGGVVHHDLKSGYQERLTDSNAGHCSAAVNGSALVFDSPIGSWYRGCPWRVLFHNRATGREVMIHSDIAPYNSKDGPMSKLHPDPHPQFVCRDRYIVCTYNAKGRMDLSVTPVAQLFEKTSAPPDSLPPRKEFDLGWDPSWNTSGSWEFAFDRGKMISKFGVSSRRAFGVYAYDSKGGVKRLEVDTLKSRMQSEEFILRFKVPPGTVRLTASANEPEPFRVRDSASVDNLFDGALRSKGLVRWHASAGGKVNWRAGGVSLEGYPEDGRAFSIEADVPPSLAGSPVKFELDLRNRAKYPWLSPVRLRQFDASGREIAADAVDSRELSCLRPVDAKIAYRLDGRLDSGAAKVRLEFSFARPESFKDDFGKPLENPGTIKLEVTRLALRPAKTIRLK